MGEVITYASEAVIKAESKMDASWERYFAGRQDLVDRYNVTVALVQGPGVLDVGCGQFLLAHLLPRSKKLDWRLVGVDISPSEIKAARKLAAERDVEIYEQDAEALTFENGEFDTVVLGQILEHAINPQAIANEAMRVLKPGGRIIVNVPCDETEPRGNHLHVYPNISDMLNLFNGVEFWQGEGAMHNFWFAWGIKA